MRWTAFPLHPETPEEGRALEDLFAGKGVNVSEMVAHLKQTARALGLPFGNRTMTYNSRRAQELGKWAEEQERGETFHHKAFQAYFVHGRNIAKLDVLKALAEETGLDGHRALEILKSEQYKEAVDQDWQRAWQMGIYAVPTFQMNGRMLVGAQTYAALKGFVIGAA